ncbi:MAG TPA: zinc-ribbon domain-containing protein [Pyrinomonadaceae bacterium]|nr:zinc-ribbon domain-containing protein [Pyrinomonadaceae bacterium]
MYCPKCGAHNYDDAKFCRACGADISLVPQALVGKIPEGAFGVVEVEEKETKGRKNRKYKFKEPPTIEQGLESIFEGIAFLVIFLIGFNYFFWAGILIWVWAIIPALGCVGKGIGQIARARELAKLPAQRHDAALTHAPAFAELQARDTAEISGQPPSITEGTTRHLGAVRTPQS